MFMAVVPRELSVYYIMCEDCHKVKEDVNMYLFISFSILSLLCKFYYDALYAVLSWTYIMFAFSLEK
jgi:hypothetical protein